MISANCANRTIRTKYFGEHFTLDYNDKQVLTIETFV